MSRHDGVHCDICSKGSFRGKRYKCLVCYDYDLCSSCFESEATSDRHTPDHPMQCILTRVDYEMYYGGEAVSFDHAMSYTCPFCGNVGFSESQLQDHVNVDHGESSSEVICPVCAATPNGDANHLTDDFTSHLAMEHRGGRDLDDAGMRMRRMLHPGRSGLGSMGSMRARRAMHHYLVGGGGGASNSGNGTGGGGGVGGGGTLQNSEASGTTASRSESRGGGGDVDSIADILSQLSGSRRAGTGGGGGASAAHLQQLQMQLQLERQQVQEHRRQLERLAMSASSPPRRLASGGGAGAVGSYSFIQPQQLLSSSQQSMAGKDRDKEIDLDTENILAALLPRMTSFDLSEDQLDASALTQLDKCSFLDNVMLSYLTAEEANVGDIELSLSSSSGSECDENESRDVGNGGGETNLNRLM